MNIEDDDPLLEVVLKKFAKANEVLVRKNKDSSDQEVDPEDPPGWPHPGPNDPGIERGGQRWAQGWPGGCSI